MRTGVRTRTVVIENYGYILCARMKETKLDLTTYVHKTDYYRIFVYNVLLTTNLRPL
jgi:hypothetical protein